MKTSIREITKRASGTRTWFLTLIALLWMQFIFHAVALQWTNDAVGHSAILILQGVFMTLLTCLFFLFQKSLKRDDTTQTNDREKLFKKNPHPMWIYDLNTLKFLAVNEAAIAVYGYSEAEFSTMTIKDIRHPDDVPSVISATEKIKLDFSHAYHWPGTWRHKTKVGQYLYVDVSSHEIIYRGVKAELVLASNVTEKVMQERQLQALNQELEWKVKNRTDDLLQLNKRLIDQNKIIKSANLELLSITSQLQEANQKIQEHADLKNKFVSMASHEFRTPLANISFSAGFVRRNFDKLDKQGVINKINAVETQVTHMVSLLDDVLTIGKADAVKLEVNIMEVDITQFAGRIIQEVQNAANGTHTIHFNIDEDVPVFIHTDEKFLRNIFINLLGNAVKYSPDCPDIYFHVTKCDDCVCFSVVDHGLGISALDVEKIFEPFYRSNPAQAINGTGLGLSIVKRAADVLNARIKVESKLGEGSSFRVFLPLI